MDFCLPCGGPPCGSVFAVCFFLEGRGGAESETELYKYGSGFIQNGKTAEADGVPEIPEAVKTGQADVCDSGAEDGGVPAGRIQGSRGLYVDDAAGAVRDGAVSVYIRLLPYGTP